MLRKIYFSIFAAVLVLLLSLFWMVLTLDESTRKGLLTEGGPIEMSSALLYFVCFGLICYRGGLRFFKSYAYLALVPLLFGMREFDLDKAFTTTGIFKTRFFTRADVPFYEKIFGFLLIAALLYMVYALIRHQTKNYLRGIIAFTPLAVGATLIAGLVLVSKTLDGLERKLESVGVSVGPLVAEHSSDLEEILELGIPIIMLLTFWNYFSQRSEEAEQALVADAKSSAQCRPDDAGHSH
jgi:hypothetical protein